MKSKGITVWELHVEKIVLGLAFIAFAYFAATQFIGNPNAATIGGQEVPPGEVDELLEQRAQAISAELGPDADPNITLPEVKPIAEQMVASLDNSISPVDTLNLPQYDMVPQGGDGIMEARLYHEPRLTAPSPTYPKQYSDALTEEVVSEYPELAEMFEPGQPKDLTYVTYFGEVDLTSIREQLAMHDPENDIAQIPSAWYGGKPLFVDVVIERAEEVDGQIVNITTLEPIPGQYSYRDWLDSDLTVNDRNTMMEDLLKPEVQSAVIQPEFLETRRGSWQPLKVGELDEQDDVVEDPDDPTARLDRYIRRTQSEIDRITLQLDELGGPLDDDEAAGGGAGGAGGGGNPGSDLPGKGGGGSGSATRPDGIGGDDRTRRRRIALTRKLRQAEELLDRYQEERAEIAGAMLVEDAQDDGPQERIMVWGHDIEVEPGKVYRYRMTFKLLNPFFGRRLSLKESQRDLADRVALESPSSEWSKPIEVNPSVRIFLTGARPASERNMNAPAVGFGTATFQVFKFYDGLMWEEDFTVAPGDRIGNVRPETVRSDDGMSRKVDIDYRTDLVVVDIIKDHDATGAGPLSDQSDAYVVLMDLKTGEITELRDPRQDLASPVREELRQEVTRSEVVASSL